MNIRKNAAFFSALALLTILPATASLAGGNDTQCKPKPITWCPMPISCPTPTTPKCPSVQPAVPESGTMTLFGLGALALVPFIVLKTRRAAQAKN